MGEKQFIRIKKMTEFFKKLDKSFWNNDGGDIFIENDVLHIDSSKNKRRNTGRNFLAKINILQYPILAEHAIKQWMGSIDSSDVVEFFNDLKNGLIPAYTYVMVSLMSGSNTNSAIGKADVIEIIKD